MTRAAITILGLLDITAFFWLVVWVAPLAAQPPSLSDRILSFAESAIGISIISTFLAAFAGTWGAQLLAEKNIRRRELLAEIRGINASIALAFNTANTYITTKKQHVIGMVEQYGCQRAARQAHSDGLKRGSIPKDKIFVYQADLQTIYPPFSPIDELRSILRDKISPDGKALVLLTPLIQSVRGLDESIAQRNAWIEEFKVLTENESYKAALYFGTQYAEGRIDERYPALMSAIAKQTDDCIAFSIMIAQSLNRYGIRKAKELGRGPPKIAAPNFEKAKDLIPDMAPYSGWLEE